MKSDEAKQPVFEEVVQDYGDYVYSLARRVGGGSGRKDADDIYQETFLRVFRFLGAFRGGSLKSWLRRITLNVIFSDARAPQSREAAVEAEELLVVADPDPHPGQRLEQSVLDEHLEEALASLPDEFRSALVLREVEQLTYEEIAEQMGVPVGTVRSRLARARRMLRDRLQEATRRGEQA